MLRSRLEVSGSGWPPPRNKHRISGVKEELSTDVSWPATAETLVAMGAPLAGFRPQASLTPEVALVQGLLFARTNATLLRALPVVLARCWRTLDWLRVEQEARARGALDTLGMLAELTGLLAEAPELTERARPWWQPAREARFFFPTRNSFDRELA